MSSDGARFLMLRPDLAGEAAAQNLVVVQHWFGELDRLAPATSAALFVSM